MTDWLIIPSSNSRDSSIMLYNIWFFMGVIGRSSAEHRRGPCTASRICSLRDSGDDTATTVFCASSSLSDDDISVDKWRLSRTEHVLKQTSQLHTSADSVTLLAVAAERRPCSNRSISHGYQPTAANPPHAAAAVNRRVRRTDTVPLHRSCCILCEQCQ